LFKILFSFLIALLFFSCSPTVKSGLDNISEHVRLFKGKHLGIIANQTAINGRGQSIVAVFKGMPDVTIAALFGPEHGFKGQSDAGAKVGDSSDPRTNVPVYSLYGAHRKPTPAMLKNVDMLVFDIQDIVSRYYTYISTMALAMEAAAEKGIPFVVLDRPNPIDGIDVQGTVLDTAFRSFVGMFPIPVRHGMTSGELATMINNEGWLAHGIRAELIVIKMKNWQRKEWFNETGLPFIKPSPNMPDIQTAALYSGLCLIEGTNVSEGRGTVLPFKMFGSHWINGDSLTDALNNLSLPGLVFVDTTFTPVSIPGMSLNPKLKNVSCSGCRVFISNQSALRPFYSGLKIIAQIYKMYPDNLKFKKGHFDRLAGSDQLRRAIRDRNDLKLDSLSRMGLGEFKTLRNRYLLY